MNDNQAQSLHKRKIRVFSFLYLLHIEHLNMHSTSKVKTFWGRVDILTGLHIQGPFKDSFKGWDQNWV